MTSYAQSPRTPETTPPDGPPRDPVEPIPREDPTIPDPTPIDDPQPGKPGKTHMGALDLEVERLIRLVESRLH
jgi:hypothetical protein